MNNKKIGFILIVTTVFLISSCKTSKLAKSDVMESLYEFNFEPSSLLSEVLEIARIEHKLVYVDMSASWCAPCQLMKRDVYTHKETAAFFNKNYISYLVDSEVNEGPDLKLIYGVTNYPTLLILDARGRVVLRREGGTFHEALIEFGKEGLAKQPTM